MKKQFCLLLLITISIFVIGQRHIIFPGITEAQQQKILNTKIPVPLPMWIPPGFSVTSITSKTEKTEDKILIINYAKSFVDGQVKFYVTAASGRGDIFCIDCKTIKSKVGDIFLSYEKESKLEIKNEDSIHIKTMYTDFFYINNQPFQVVFISRCKLKKTELSITDAKKILQSIRVLK